MVRSLLRTRRHNNAHLRRVKTTVSDEQRLAFTGDGRLIHIDKPYGMSSFGALAHIRYLLSRRLGVKRVKIGHAGTLDPLATGVLVLCTGRKTKDIEQLQACGKEYIAGLRLGRTTASYDREHTVDMVWPTAHITRESIEQTLRQFTGEIDQVPPQYSACKIAGERAYRIVRDGEQAPLTAKRVRIDNIELLDFDPQQMTMNIRVECGKGTYIRALARDIGQALHSGAFLTSLRRTRSGETRVEDCMTLEQARQWIDRIE